MSAAIDLNADVGEGFGGEAGMYGYVTSVNVACGGHAGDEGLMREAMRRAGEHGVAVGAHPGFEDKKNFGREEQCVTPAEVKALVLRQVGALRAVADGMGVRLSHLKPHGALYNQAAKDPALAGAIAEAVKDLGGEMILFGLAGSASIALGRAQGLRVAEEAFADRRYLPSGQLVSRKQFGAVIGDENEMVEQAMRLAEGKAFPSITGQPLTLRADTICLHGDGPRAAAFARRLRLALETAGMQVRAPTLPA